MMCHHSNEPHTHISSIGIYRCPFNETINMIILIKITRLNDYRASRHSKRATRVCSQIIIGNARERAYRLLDRDSTLKQFPKNPTKKMRNYS